MKKVLPVGLGAVCAMGVFLAGIELVRAADPGPARDAGLAESAAAPGSARDAGTVGVAPAVQTSKDGGTFEPAVAPAAQSSAEGGTSEPSSARQQDAGKVEPVAAKEPPVGPAKTEAGPALPLPVPAPAAHKRPAPSSAKTARRPKNDLGLILAGSGAALAGATAMGLGIWYLHVDGRSVCKPGEIAPCDFVRDTATFGDVMLASGSGVFLLGAAAFFWGFYGDDTGVAVSPTGMVVNGRF
jgi:hypothetical protein